MNQNSALSITSDAEIMDLISCVKFITSTPKRPTEINKNVTQTFDVSRKDSDLRLSVFITYSSRMQQDFSIGLMCGSYLLYRLNGFHGTTRAGFYSSEHHAYTHAHILTVDDIKNARERKPSHIEDLAGAYFDLRSARLFFFRRCGIINHADYFDPHQQIEFEIP